MLLKNIVIRTYMQRYFSSEIARNKKGYKKIAKNIKSKYCNNMQTRLR